jgi:tripartite-type tricarboxylate transporter receptor subunit TctC
MDMKRRTVLIGMTLTALGFALPAQADDYPSRNVTIVVPYPAGGPTDELARVVADSLSKQMNQSFVVENVTGGGTIIATNKVVKSSPDGYTLLLHNLQISANPTLYKSLPFDTTKDLTPVIFINRNPLVLIARKDLPANNLDEFLALMKKQTIKAAIPGYGATGHLATSLLAQEAHAKIDMIPYRGAAPALNDVLGGHVDVFFATPQQIVQQVKAGNVKALGITSKQPLPELPNVKSFVDVLGPKLEFHYWQALFTPSATPQPVIEKLNADISKMMDDPKVKKRWADEGVEGFPPEDRSVAAARKIMKSEMERWGKVIKDNNIHLEQ